MVSLFQFSFIMVGVDLDIPSLIKEPSLLLIIPVLIFHYFYQFLAKPSVLFVFAFIPKQWSHN